MATIAKNKGQGKIFENEALEILTKTSPSITIVTYGSIITLLILYGIFHYNYNILEGIGLFAGGLFFWTFFEYIMHRYIFHWLGEFKFGKKITYALHGVHHEYPRDEQRLFMPPVPGIIIISILFTIGYFTLGHRVYIFLPGLLLGYLCYAYIHYSIHKYQAPKILKRMWVNHTLHHYKDHDKAFGVTTPLWDFIFGTLPDKDPNNKH
jgi:sterol desaturase/sphingolipid hydroxylase (fatty acid hydroxylase superfamily)